ncbi:hypothetical protein N9L48_03260 [Psychrosphaera sp.]|nr:hypothetical protein [Psychrosphaera sp.]
MATWFAFNPLVMLFTKLDLPAPGRPRTITTSNPDEHFDKKLFAKLGLNSEQTKDYSDETKEAALFEQLKDQQQPEKEMFFEAK